MEKKSFWERLLLMKQELKVEKGNFNRFGKFNYRTKEQIFEALKPLEAKYFIYISTDHDIKEYQDRLFIEAVAEARDVLDNGVVKLRTTSKAELQPVGTTQMNESQLTGSAETYAAKRAVEAMFGIDNAKDADDEELVRDEPQIKRLGGKPSEEPQDEPKKLGATPLGAKVVNTKPHTEEEVEQIIKDNTHTEETDSIHKIRGAALNVTTLEDVLELEQRLAVLGGDDTTKRIIDTKALGIGLVRNLKTGKWEEK